MLGKVNEVARQLFIKNLLKKTVLDSEAKTLGIVKDMVLDVDDWTLAELHIKIDSNMKKELELGGFGSKTIKVPPSYVQRLGDFVDLSVPARQLVEECEFA